MAELSYSYEPKLHETHWQAAWRQAQTQAPLTQSSKKPFYMLEMFPYPSGDLHMGHVRNYTLGDVFARYKRKQGFDVLHPMGWDALGLPAENQAIKEKIAPQVRTPKNVAQMKRHMESLGLAYDWDREIATYQSTYYRWNQWFFLKFLERGWVYRRESNVNYCPGCNTILANEQVRDDGTCWRGHPGVTTRTIPEWAFRITDFAEELLEGLSELSAWPERIVTQQRNWIGKSTGAHLRFPVVGGSKTIEVFTTRADTVYGCTYIVLAPEHPLVQSLTTPDTRPVVDAFIERMRQTDSIERTSQNGAKEGVFTGSYAVNPFTGENVPIWLANFVLAHYGTGAVMSVPAHDARDFAFAQQYKLPKKAVIAPTAEQAPSGEVDEPYLVDGFVHHSGPFTGLASSEARDKITQFAQKKNIGEGTVNWHLRDWGFSRQRYWGTPIPIVYCDKDGMVPVPEEQLPVTLPAFEDIELTGQGGAPLGKLASFRNTTCPKCRGPATREIDTMDTFVDSAWYFARFLSPHADNVPFDKAMADTWLPVDIYVGGPEHAVMHLLYFRFWTRAMQKLGLVSVKEPVKRLITQGMVNAATLRCPKHSYVAAKDAPDSNCPDCKTPLLASVEKMSKSKYNGVDPARIIEKYGADTARLYVLFAAPPEKDLEWSDEGVEGTHRFLGRVWRLLVAQGERIKSAQACTSMQGLSGPDAAVRRAVHRCLAKVTEEMNERNHFNTAIAAMMELTNTLYEHKLHEGAGEAGIVKESLTLLAHMLAPFAPHLAEEMGAHLGHDTLVANAAWPAFDAAALVQDTLTFAVQVNGKLRAQLTAKPDVSEEELVALARQDPNVTRHLDGKRIRKQIFVRGRLLNFVVSDA